METLLPLNRNSTLKPSFCPVSPRQDFSNSEWSTWLLSSAMNLCIEAAPHRGYCAPVSKSLRVLFRFRLRASSCFNRRFLPGFR